MMKMPHRRRHAPNMALFCRPLPSFHSQIVISTSKGRWYGTIYCELTPRLLVGRKEWRTVIQQEAISTANHRSENAQGLGTCKFLMFLIPPMDASLGGRPRSHCTTSSTTVFEERSLHISARRLCNATNLPPPLRLLEPQHRTSLQAYTT